MKTFRRKVLKAELEYAAYRCYFWLLDLDCGHFVSKHQSGREPPATTLCHHCQKLAKEAKRA